MEKEKGRRKKKKEEELWRDWKEAIGVLTSRQAGPRRFGGRLLNIQGGVSLQRQQSSRYPGRICLPDSSVSAGGP